MAASLLFERRFLKQFPTVPSDYVPASTLAEVFVERIANGWNVCDGVGLIPLLTTAGQNFYLYNPKLSLNKNRVVKMTFSVANLSDQIGVVARGQNTPNGQGAMYNGGNGTLQSFRFYDNTGVTFQGFGSSWTPTINTLYNLYGYARSVNASDTTVKSWATSTTNLLTHLADGTTFTDSQADTQGNSVPSVTGFGPFTQAANDGTKVTRLQAWSVDGTFSACASITSAASGVTLECFPVDGTGSTYTVQWYKSATATGTFAAITGATTSIYEYTGGTAGVKEHFKAIITDTSNSATATSEIMPGMKIAAAKAIAVASDSFWARTINADNSGTSNMGSQATLFGQYLAANLNRDVTIVNGAVSGITARVFIDTYMTAHLAACATAGVTHAVVQFGANYTTATTDAEVLTVAQTAFDDIEEVTQAYIDADIVPIIFPAQCCTPYGRARGGIYAAETMDRINVLLDDIIDGVNILAGDTGQSDWIAANPHFFPDQLHFGETGFHLSAARAANRVAFLLDPTALGVPLAGPVGDNTITVGELVTLLRIVARNAGISDTDDATYELANKHLAIQLILEYLIRRTKTVTQTISDFTITDGSNAITLAGVAGFHTERLQEAWLDTTDAASLKPVSIQELGQVLARDGDSGKPDRIAFSTSTGVGKVYPTPDDDYTGKVRWWAPLTGWTAGDSGVDSLAINVPADIARGAIMAGGIWALQKNQPQHAKIADQSYGELQNYANSILSAGSLSARSFTRPEPC